MNPNEKSSNDIIFFLGAGASVEAHVPDTQAFIYGNKKNEPGFIQWLLEKGKNNEHELLMKILQSIGKSKEEIIDVELILQILHELNTIEQNLIVRFYNKKTFKFKSPEDIRLLKELENDLRQFIREKVTVKKEAIAYLTPLLAFQKPIKIFSVNYDTCIELLCMTHRLTYTDGFELNWQRDLFNKDFDVKLFKLHGSIIWYSTDRHNYLKLPIIQDEISIISEETARPFISYPMGNKGEFAEPLDALSSEFQANLKSAMVCIVVGYTFRDKDIRQLFFEISQKNELLKVVLISPNAGKIFQNRLKYFDDPAHTLSTLADKIICWNYTFGAVLKDYYLSRNLQTNIPLLKNIYDRAEQARKEGVFFEKSFKDCIDIAISLDDLVTVESILRKELGINPPEFGPLFKEPERFKILYSLAILHLFNSDERNKEYFRYLVDYLIAIKVSGESYFEFHRELKDVKDKIDRITSPLPVSSSLPLENTDLLRERDIASNKIKGFRDMFPEHLLPFYYWPVFNPPLFDAIKEFKEFLHLRIKLREGILEYSDLLMKIARICQQIGELRESSEKYKESNKIEIDGKIIEIRRIQELLKLFIDLIEILKDYSE